MTRVSEAHPPSSLPILIKLDLIVSPDIPALALAVKAIQASADRLTEKKGRASWRQRAHAAGNSLNKLFPAAELSLQDQSKNILRQAGQSIPTSDNARLLSDAMNLDDFGIRGLLQQALHLGASGSNLPRLLESFRQQEQYGYWEARLKEDFHFEPVRRLAAQRLSHLRKVAAMLKEELDAGG